MKRGHPTRKKDYYLRQITCYRTILAEVAYSADNFDPLKKLSQMALAYRRPDVFIDKINNLKRRQKARRVREE